LRHSAERFLKIIAKIEKPIAVDWGFPPGYLTLVEMLKLSGFAVWWLDGDREAALESFIGRGTVSPEAFGVQMKAIVENWPKILDLFEDNMIYAVSTGPSYATPEFIYSKMLAKRRP
jgi:hypothetical protein